MSDKLDLRANLARVGRLKGVLCPVKDENLAVDAERGDDVWILRLVPGLVDLSRVLNLVHNVALDGRHVARFAVAANLAALLVVVVRVRGHGLGDLDVGDLKVIWAVIRGMGAEKKAMGAKVLTLDILDVWEPLDGESRPGQGFAVGGVNIMLHFASCHVIIIMLSENDLPQDHVVEEGTILLPCLVLCL